MEIEINQELWNKHFEVAPDTDDFTLKTVLEHYKVTIAFTIAELEKMKAYYERVLKQNTSFSDDFAEKFKLAVQMSLPELTKQIDNLKKQLEA